jgi:hypothetical protein
MPLDNMRRGGDGANGNGKPANDAEVETIVEVAAAVVTGTSQSAVERVPALR